ncbi:MAG TPA: PilZ domain-containing protein [Candidatus Acidoferrum sp.]|nr:PilZ domain-containing protein [Candidatus Acidoferrum sp.]
MAGVRRSGRIAKEIKIFLSGTDTTGRFFSEETKTVVLSRHGAGILSKRKLASDELLSIRLFGTSAEARMRLVGQIGQEVCGYTYGVEFLDPELDFWELKFPPPPQWHSNPDSALECGVCHDRQIVSQNEIEADVYALLQNILRFCARCGTSTVWRAASSASAPSQNSPRLVRRPPSVSPVLAHQAVALTSESSFAGSLAAHSYSAENSMTLTVNDSYAAEALVETLQSSASPPMASQAGSPPTSPASATAKPNRRRYLRSRVNFTAMVRHPELGEEIAESDDISKGGFSFRSRKSYPLDSMIEVAVPYTPGWDALFVPACIKHVEELPGGTLFRYGAAYTTPPKTRPAL